MSATACRVNQIDFEEVTVDLFKSQHLTPEFRSTILRPVLIFFLFLEREREGGEGNELL